MTHTETGGLCVFSCDDYQASRSSQHVSCRPVRSPTCMMKSRSVVISSLSMAINGLRLPDWRHHSEPFSKKGESRSVLFSSRRDAHRKLINQWLTHLCSPGPLCSTAAMKFSIAAALLVLLAVANGETVDFNLLSNDYVNRIAVFGMVLQLVSNVSLLRLRGHVAEPQRPGWCGQHHKAH